MIQHMTKWMQGAGLVSRATLGCVLVIASAGLTGCSHTPAEVLRVDTPPPVEQTSTFTSSHLGVTLQYPAAWQPDRSGNSVRSGEDGFFNVTAAGLWVPTAEEACKQELEANLKKENRFGQKPTMDNLQVDNQPACLIMPSADQPEPEKGLALLVVQYPPQPGKPRVLLQLWADEQHIRDLGRSLRFTEPERQTTPDASTPVPPAGGVRTFTSAYVVSLSFNYR